MTILVLKLFTFNIILARIVKMIKEKYELCVFETDAG